ncbi:galactosyl transferase gma12 mnn10 family protein [Colletotrichum karsti]|uniref:Galactosyl transferase gma12 mnn10 family protein n=1 Tax=Colletotrichum karsti TaxID=1095194 RepID=A0A9P6I3Q8_9PEZI|nr:galactosyl transferase gma12 mnn10 family protein [Colletotrichum karsti]KAF9876773.1 galactosyl transferase gma12 mnn10 family protein [Colletotrichum karsti]
MRVQLGYPLIRAFYVILPILLTAELLYMFHPFLARLRLPRSTVHDSRLRCHGGDGCFPSIHESLAEDVAESIRYCRNNSEEMNRQNPRIATVTAQFGKHQNHYARALRTHLVHTLIHDAELHVLCESIVDDFWNKPAFILSLLLEELEKPEDERLEWLFWVDRDTIILDNCRSPASFLPPPAGWAASGSDSGYVNARKDNPHDDMHLIISNDWNGLNNGIFLLRVNRWSLDLFDSILAYRHYNPDVKLRFTEQSAMELLLQEEKFRHNVTLVPQHWINPYPGDFPEDDGVKLDWEFFARPGDFLVHFAGYEDRDKSMLPWLDIAEERTTGWAAGPTVRKLDYEIAEFWRKRFSKDP